MKKIYTILVALAVAVGAYAQEEESGVSFAHEYGMTLQTTYLWRGQFLGGLTFEPDVCIGYDGEKTSLRVGACADLSASDWKFVKGKEWYPDGFGGEVNPNTYFNPELDLYANFSFLGVGVNFTHYQYWDYTKSGKYEPWHQGEVGIGYDFSYFFEKVNLHINWYTILYGTDHNYEYEELPAEQQTDGVLFEETSAKRAYSSYLEVGYMQPLPLDMSLALNVGMSPWRSDDVYMNTKFAVVNVHLRYEKCWSIENICDLTLFAETAVNPDMLSRDKHTAYVNAAGAEKVCNQSWIGNIGFSVWF